LGAFLHFGRTVDMPYALMWSSTVIFICYPPGMTVSSAMEVVWLDVPPLLATKRTSLVRRSAALQAALHAGVGCLCMFSLRVLLLDLLQRLRCWLVLEGQLCANQESWRHKTAEKQHITDAKVLASVFEC
jgi:hypothetical protein